MVGILTDGLSITNADSLAGPFVRGTDNYTDISPIHNQRQLNFSRGEMMSRSIDDICESGIGSTLDPDVTQHHLRYRTYRDKASYMSRDNAGGPDRLYEQ
jgi:hypothetical protein